MADAPPEPQLPTSVPSTDSRRNGMVLGVFGAATAFVLVLILGGLIVGMRFSPTDEERAARAEARSQRLHPVEVAGLYADHCASCHGPSGQGLSGPGFAGISTRLTEDELVDVVRNGRNAMPRFAGVLLDAEIEAIVDYSRTTLDGAGAVG